MLARPTVNLAASSTPSLIYFVVLYLSIFSSLTWIGKSAAAESKSRVLLVPNLRCTALCREPCRHRLGSNACLPRFITPLFFDLLKIITDAYCLCVYEMRRLEKDLLRIVVDDKLLNGSRLRLSGFYQGGRSTQLPREIHAEEQFIRFLFV